MKRSTKSYKPRKVVKVPGVATLSLLTSDPSMDRFYVPLSAPIDLQIKAVRIGLTLH